MNHSPYGQRRTNSPLKHHSPVKKTARNHGHVPPFLAKMLYDCQLLEDDHHKIQAMPKEHLTMYILDFLESYSKQKGSSDAPAAYLVSYMEKRQITKTSVKKTANSIAISLAHFQSTNHEIEFFHKIFCQTTPMVKPAAHYIYSRKIVRSFFNSRHSLENLKISLGDWTTLVQKIFRDQPTAEIINRLKEKIMSYNLKRVLGTTVSPTTYHQDSNLSLRSQHQIMDIDALYFVVICVEEFQDLQVNRSPVRERSRSPPQTNSFTKIITNDVIEQNTYYSNSNKMSNYSSSKSISPPIKEKKRTNGRLQHEVYEEENSPSPFDVLNLMKAAKEMEEREINLGLFDDRYHQNKSKGNTRKSSHSSVYIQDDHGDEIIELKREISHKTFQKRTSFENLLSLFNLYENMADQNQEVLKFLKQMQHDFATLIAKVKKQEPGLSEIINFGFVEKFILNLPSQQDFEKSKNIARIKENLGVKTTPTKKSNKVRSLHVSPSRETVIVEPMSLKDFQPQIFLSVSERKSRQIHKNTEIVANSSKTPQKQTPNTSDIDKEKNIVKNHEKTTPITIEENVPENTNSEAVLNHAKQIYMEYQGGLEEIPEESQISNMSGSIASFTKEPVLADLDLSTSKRFADSSPRDEFVELTKSVEFTKKKSSIIKETIVLQEIQTEEKPEIEDNDDHHDPVDVLPPQNELNNITEIEKAQSLEKFPEVEDDLKGNSKNNDETILTQTPDENETPQPPSLNRGEEVQKNEPEFLEKSSENKKTEEEKDEDLKKKKTIIEPNIPEIQAQMDLPEEDSLDLKENKLISPTHQIPLAQDDHHLPQPPETIQNNHDHHESKKTDQIQDVEKEPIPTNVQIQGDLPDPPKISLEPSLNIIKEDPPPIVSQKEPVHEPVVTLLENEKENFAVQQIQKEEDPIKEVIPEPVVLEADQSKKDESPPPSILEKPKEPEIEKIIKNHSSESLKHQDEEHKAETKPAKKFTVPAFLKHNAQKPTPAAATALPDENHNKPEIGKVEKEDQNTNKKPVIEEPQALTKTDEDKNKEIITAPPANNDDHKPSEDATLKKENSTPGLQLEKLSAGSDSTKDLKAEPTKPLTPSKPKFTVPKFLKKGGAGSEKNSVQSHGQNHETGSNTSVTPALSDFDVDESKKRSSSNAHQQKPEVSSINSQNEINDKRSHSQSHSALPLTSESEKIFKTDAALSANSDKDTVVPQQQQPKEDPQPKVEDTEPKATAEVDDKNNNKPQAPPEEVDKSKETNPPSQDTAAKPAEKKFTPPKFSAPKFGKKT